MALLDEEQPDEVLITPECKLWSRMQSLGRRTWHQQEALIAARARHHDRHLLFAKKVYLAQANGGRHATLEQPKHALSWRTRALRDLPGRRADFSQCRYGAQCLDEDGVWRPVRKDTTLLTTKRAVQDAMSLTCQKDHQHCHLEGAAPWLWLSHSIHGRVSTWSRSHIGWCLVRGRATHALGNSPCSRGRTTDHRLPHQAQGGDQTRGHPESFNDLHMQEPRSSMALKHWLSC